MKDGEIVQHAKSKGSRKYTIGGVVATVAAIIAVACTWPPIGEAFADVADAAVQTVAEALEIGAN
jgi:hypothetical protein